MKPNRKHDMAWALNIKEEASYKCAVIGCKRAGIEAHHLSSRRYKDNRYGLGIALCRYHHRMIHDHPWKLSIEIKDRKIILKEVGEA